MPSRDSARTVKSVLTFVVDRASVQNVMNETARVARAQNELISTWPENMQKAAEKAFKVVVDELAHEEREHARAYDEALRNAQRHADDVIQVERQIAMERREILRTFNIARRTDAKRAAEELVEAERIIRDETINARRQSDNLQRLFNRAKRADARQLADDERAVIRQRLDDEKRAATFRQTMRNQEMNELQAQAKRELTLEQERFAAKVNFINQYQEKMRAAHAQERAEIARKKREDEEANKKAPFLQAHGFAGMASGGGFGGLTFTGRAAAGAAVGLGMLQWGAREAESFRESDFAIHRMMTLVSEAERQSGQNFDKLRSDAMKLAVVLGTTIPEAADAMREALTNAIPASQAANFVQTTNQLAIMEGNDVKSTINSIASIRNAYGMSDKDMMEVPDVLFAAMDRGNVKMKELAGQIGQLSGMADEAGISFKEMMAALANATLRGMSGSVASTSLRNIAMKIVNPTDKVRAEQERIGFRLTPEIVEQMGFNEAINKFEKAIENGGSTWAKAFSNDIRTLKIIPFLTENGGQNSKVALADQVAAIREQRALKGSEELLSSDLKKWAQIREQLDQLGQSFGQIFSKVQVALMSFFAGSGTGQVSGRDRNILREQIIQEQGKGSPVPDWVLRMVMSTERVDEEAKFLDQKEKEHGRKFQSRTDVSDFETRKKGVGFAEMSADDQFRGNLKSRTDEFNESHRQAAEKRDHDDKLTAANTRRLLDEQISKVMKLETQYENLGKSNMSHLLAQLERANHLTGKMADDLDKAQNDMLATGEQIESARAGREKLSGAGRILSGLGRGNAAHLLNQDFNVNTGDMKDFDKRTGRAMSAFGSLQGQDLLSVARTGQFKYADVNSYAEQVSRDEGLRGSDSTKRTRGIFSDADRQARDIVKGYGQYKSLPGSTPDSGFGDWFIEQKMRKTEDLSMKVKDIAVDSRRKDLEAAEESARAIEGALKTQETYQNQMVAAFERAKTISENLSDDLQGAADSIRTIFQEIGLLHSSQESGAFGRMPANSVAAKANGVAINGDLVVQVAPGDIDRTTAKIIGTKVLQAIQEAQDRGTGTTDTNR